MKICGIICEFNPFHNGHAYLIGEARRLSGCDTVVCVMSGNYTQRGESACLDKYTRARHAVLGGADLVLELPPHFAVAPAEIFAKGGIKILASLPRFSALAFGCESGDKADFSRTAEILSDESEKFKAELSRGLERGESYVKSYASAFEKCGGDGEFISRPNNLLGAEYAKAVLSFGCGCELLPVNRVGAEYADGELKENYSSARAIRENVLSPLALKNVPEFVRADLKNADDGRYFRELAAFAALDGVKDVFGCGEGLENKITALSRGGYEKIICGCTSKRYSSARIKRILCANLLKLYSSEALNALSDGLFLKPLAVKKERADEIFACLALSSLPVAARQRDIMNLSAGVKRAVERYVRADEIYGLCTGGESNYFRVDKV